MLKIFFIYRNDPCFLIVKDKNIFEMNTETEVVQPEQTEQLISSLVQFIYENFLLFGQKCRSYIQSQHQQGITIAPLENKQSKNNYAPSTPAYSNNVASPYKSSINTVNKDYKAPVKQPKFTRNEDGEQVPYMAKRPRNAYNLFVQSQSVKIKEQNPHMRAPDIVRIAAERYNSMNQEQKRPYLQKFEEAKRIYDRQVHQMGNRMPIPRKRGRGSRYDYSLKS